MKIARYKLKPEVTLDRITIDPFRMGGGCLHNNAVLSLCRSLTENVSVHIDFPPDLRDWNDFDYVLVQDEVWGQPYSPFYGENFGKDIPGDCRPLYPILQRYNQIMGSFDFFEEQK